MRTNSRAAAVRLLPDHRKSAAAGRMSADLAVLARAGFPVLRASVIPRRRRAGLEELCRLIGDDCQVRLHIVLSSGGNAVSRYTDSGRLPVDLEAKLWDRGRKRLGWPFSVAGGSVATARRVAECISRVARRRPGASQPLRGEFSYRR